MRFLAIFVLFWSLTSRAEILVDPQFVVDKVLGEGRQAKQIELEAQQAYTAYYTNFSIYDWRLGSTLSTEDSKKQLISGAQNLRDKTGIWDILVSKRIPTGTNFDVGYTRTTQNSTYRPGVVNIYRGGYAVYDVGAITVTQDLLGNFFGIAERKANKAAESLLRAADLQKKEAQESLVLDALKLFWDTFVARESLREAISQRDRYEALVKDVENKNHLGFAAPGDLPKSRAELNAQVRNVKLASFTYLKNLDLLLTAMKMQDVSDRDIRFVLKEEMPALPTMVMPDVESLRITEIAKNTLDSAELTKSATEISADWPELKLIGKTSYTGLEATKSRAFASMSSGEHPDYYLALTFNYRFFSDKVKADKNQAGVNYEIAFNSFLKFKEDLRQQIGTAMENVRYTYAAAISSTEELKQWEAAIKAQETSYRQGRLDFSQFILDYNSYFQSRSNRLRAIGDYHIALHAYAASVDQLVK
ncbi:MAG: TolC family protein [Bdellovibrionota bacterium]